MPQELVSLSDYADAFQAETVRIRLAAAGIQVIVTGTDAAAALSMGGAGSDRLVRVEVAQQDYQRAAKLLLEDKERLRNAKPWICSGCNEQNEPAFEVCWSCSKQQTEDDRFGRIHEETREALQQSDRETSELPNLVDDGNPYRAVLVSADAAVVSRLNYSQETDEQKLSVRHALLASIVGMIMFPPLVSCYAVYLLLSLGVQTHRLKTFRTRLGVSWIINLVNIAVWCLFWWA